MEGPLKKSKSEHVFFNVNLIYYHICPYLTLDDRSRLSQINRRTYEKLGELDEALRAMRPLHTFKTRVWRFIHLAQNAPLESLNYLLVRVAKTSKRAMEEMCSIAAAEVGRSDVITYLINQARFMKSYLCEQAIVELLTHGHPMKAREIYSAAPTQMGVRTIWTKCIIVGDHEFEEIVFQRLPEYMRRKHRFSFALKLMAVTYPNIAEVQYWLNKGGQKECLPFYRHYGARVTNTEIKALLDDFFRVIEPDPRDIRNFFRRVERPASPK